MRLWRKTHILFARPRWWRRTIPGSRVSVPVLREIWNVYWKNNTGRAQNLHMWWCFFPGWSCFLPGLQVGWCAIWYGIYFLTEIQGNRIPTLPGHVFSVKYNYHEKSVWFLIYLIYALSGRLQRQDTFAKIASLKISVLYFVLTFF